MHSRRGVTPAQPTWRSVPIDAQLFHHRELGERPFAQTTFHLSAGDFPNSNRHSIVYTQDRQPPLPLAHQLTPEIRIPQ